MSNDSAVNSDFIFAPEDLEDPLNWIEKLSKEQLRDWLRNSLWTGVALPVVTPSSSRLAIEVSSLLKRGSSQLKARVRTVIPTLLPEWGRDDATSILDDLLIICGRLRCAAAESAIALLITQRLPQQPELVPLRQRCLSVLSGFGCNKRTAFVFEEYIKNIEYAAICYRALYRYDLRYAATELQDIVSMFQDDQSLHELDIITRTLASDLQSPEQFVSILAMYLKHAEEPKLIIHVLEALRGVGLLSAAPFLGARQSERVDIFRLLLERCPPSDFQDLLWKLDSVGLGLYGVELEDGEEYIQSVAYDPMAEQKVVDRIIATKNLNDEVVRAFVAGSETVAKIWAAAPEIEWIQ